MQSEKKKEKEEEEEAGDERVWAICEHDAPQALAHAGGVAALEQCGWDTGTINAALDPSHCRVCSSKKAQ